MSEIGAEYEKSIMKEAMRNMLEKASLVSLAEFIQSVEDIDDYTLRDLAINTLMKRLRALRKHS